MKLLYKSSVSLGLLLLMAGCAAPELGPLAKLHGANELAAKDSIGKPTLSAAAWPTEKWWQRYGDPQLDTLLDEALKLSPSLKMAQARVRQAEAIAGRAEAASSPQLSLADKNNRQLFSGHGTTPPPVAGQWKWVNEATLTGSYEFDFWGKNQSAIEAAVGITHAVEVDAYTARLVLVTNILRSYVRLQQAYQQLDIATATLARRLRILELTQQRVRARIDSSVDLKQAESLVPAAKVQIAQINEAIALSRAELGALTGQGPDRGLALARPAMRESRTTLLPSDVPAELIGRRPDVVALRWRVEAAGQEITNAKAQFYPNISLTAFIGMQSLGFPNFNDAASRITGIGPALSLPVFDGGRLKSNLAGRNAEYDYAVEQYNATVIDAVRDVVSQLVSLRGIEEQRSLQREAVATADDAYQLASQRYRSGVGNYLQVLSAELQKLASERLQSDLDMRAIELDIALARSLGGGFAPQG
jgi:NodT family efflux transporter outer membrane factor (OMF) lipoprotein